MPDNAQHNTPRWRRVLLWGGALSWFIGILERAVGWISGATNEDVGKSLDNLTKAWERIPVIGSPQFQTGATIVGAAALLIVLAHSVYDKLRRRKRAGANKVDDAEESVMDRLGAFLAEGGDLLRRAKDGEPPIAEGNQWFERLTNFIEKELGSGYLARLNNFSGMKFYGGSRFANNIDGRLRRLHEFMSEITPQGAEEKKSRPPDGRRVVEKARAVAGTVAMIQGLQASMPPVDQVTMTTRRALAAWRERCITSLQEYLADEGAWQKVHARLHGVESTSIQSASEVKNNAGVIEIHLQRLSDTMTASMIRQNTRISSGEDDSLNSAN